MNIQEVRSRLDYDSRDPDYRNTADLLKSEPDEVVFEALFPIAVHSQSAGPAWPAAILLCGRRPRCPLSCQEAIRALLNDWDVSIEEVPFYLIGQFGVEEVGEAIARLRRTDISEFQIRMLDAVAYWVKIWVEWKVGEKAANAERDA